MIILDTDCLSLLERGNTEAKILIRRLDESPTEEVATTIITFEEQMRGWLAYLAKAKTIEQQVIAYEKLSRFLNNYQLIQVLPFEEVAALEYKRLRELKLRVGSMDLKIASIAKANNALLLTRNTKDFEQIPQLNIADWTR